jgi:hypothetical protein
MLPRDRDPQFIAAVKSILADLRMRGANQDYCARCETNDWNVDVIRVFAIPMPLANGGPPTALPPPSQAYIPTLCIVCNKCGNMILHNLQSLTRTDPAYLRKLGFKE